MENQSATDCRLRFPYKLSDATEAFVRKSNEIPDDFQVREIQDSIDAARKVRAGLSERITEVRARLHQLEQVGAPRRQITETQLTLLNLEREDRPAARNIVRCSGPFLLVRRLPAEILSRIFVLHHQSCFEPPKVTARFARRSGDEESITFFPLWAPSWISETCIYWRNITLATQELWSTIRYNCTTQTPDTETALGIRTWIERGGDWPLSFSFTCQGHHGILGDDGPAEVPPVGHACRDVFDLLLSQGHRWREVHLTLSEVFLPKLVVLRGNLPLLEKLHYTNLTGPEPGGDDLDAFTTAPRLYDLSLSNVLGRVVATFPWAQITHYCGDHYDHAHTHILHLAPNISTITLKLEGDTLPQTLIHRLDHLRVTSGSLTLIVGEDIFRRIQLPSLKSFRCTLETPIPALVRILQRYGTTVTTLHIDNFIVHSSILNFLGAATAVESLTVIGPHYLYIQDPTPSHEVDRIFDRLAYRPGQAVPALFPRLRELHASGLEVHTAFVRVLESRRVASPETVKLEMVVLTDIKVRAAQKPEIDTRLRDLKRQGMRLSLSGL
ncbi:hypothetical protein B0H11DRAFT_2277649 [Mycena galericulata]|nr:hypothetical protein B0H11DRAFT_2277649 [Mycena galericulata]